MTSRLTVVETVYYQPSESIDPVSVETRYSRALLTEDEDAYIKRLKIGKNWMPLDYRWIDTPGLLVLRNDAGTFAVNPTAEERQIELSKVIELRYQGETGTWLVYPQESHKGLPTRPLEVRCTSGETRITLVVLPD